MADFARLRNRMVDRQLEARGIRDPAVLDAFRSVPREAFVGEAMAASAYDDRPLPIGAGQTISQPYIVALMIEAAAIRRESNVLEVGAGSGYAAALLGRIAGRVTSIERHVELATAAARRLKQLGICNVEIQAGDGTLGCPERSPFDAVLVAAGSPEAPRPLLDQLAIGGRLVIPLGSGTCGQRLMRITRTSETAFDGVELCGVRFVPLIGAHGFES